MLSQEERFMSLQLTVISAHDLLSSERQEIIDVCTEAYNEMAQAVLEYTNLIITSSLE